MPLWCLGLYKVYFKSTFNFQATLRVYSTDEDYSQISEVTCSF